MTTKTKMIVSAFTENAQNKHIREDIVKNPDLFIKKLMKGSRFAFGVTAVADKGYYLEMGWGYNFRPFLKKYLFKKHGQWHEIYALNKGNARHLIYGQITKIIEIN